MIPLTTPITLVRLFIHREPIFCNAIAFVSIQAERSLHFRFWIVEFATPLDPDFKHRDLPGKAISEMALHF